MFYSRLIFLTLIPIEIGDGRNKGLGSRKESFILLFGSVVLVWSIVYITILAKRELRLALDTRQDLENGNTEEFEQCIEDDHGERIRRSSIEGNDDRIRRCSIEDNDHERRRLRSCSIENNQEQSNDISLQDSTGFNSAELRVLRYTGVSLGVGGFIGVALILLLA